MLKSNLVHLNTITEEKRVKKLMTLQNKSFGGDSYLHQKRQLVLFCGSHKRQLIIYLQCLSECSNIGLLMTTENRAHC